MNHNKNQLTGVLEIEVGLLLKGEAKRIILSCQMKDGCGDVKLTTGPGILSQTFYLKGPVWQVNHIRDVLQLFLSE